MTQNFFASQRPRLFVPEVVQTSAMDCGPAALKALLEGFGIQASYGRLREACQTDVDGTSIDTLEEIAGQLGLVAEQVMVPPDHVLLAEAQCLPAIVVVRLPNGLTHFVVVWNQIGPFIQVMDPGNGRRWQTPSDFLKELYIHSQEVPAAAWREWAGTEDFARALQHRLKNLGGPEAEIQALLEVAQADPHWSTFGALDAATRMVTALVQAKGFEVGTEAFQLLKRLFEEAQAEPATAMKSIPKLYWSVQAKIATEEEAVLMSGAVLIRVLGWRSAEAAQRGQEGEAEAESQTLAPDLVAALQEKTSRPEGELWRFLREDGLLSLTALAAALAWGAGSVLLQAILLRGLLDLGQVLPSVEQRAGALGLLLAFLLGQLLLEIPLTAIMLRLGRHLEARMRVAFLTKIPRLGDRYFHSRLVSDMTQRAHDLSQLISLPQIGTQFLRNCFQIFFTMLGVIWLDPQNFWLVILATLSALGMSFFSQPFLLECDLRLRTITGGLSRFYLDALLGLIPLRTHRAEKAIRRQHEGLLTDWIKANFQLYRVHVGSEGFQGLTGLLFTVWIVFNYISKQGDPRGLFLIFFWTLAIPALGRKLTDLAQQYPIHRNRTLRILEPLQAPEEKDQGAEEPEEISPTPEPASAQAATLALEDVTVLAGGHTILHQLNLTFKAGEHVAIVGPSGAGKSSLVGLLLGWHRPASGRLLVDGKPLRGQRLQALRRETAWLDPAVHLWNCSLLENLRYGSTPAEAARATLPLEQANLFSLLEKLPQGLQTTLGESGGLVSGGEGQRVRLGRAMFRTGIRLVILDEPFRGLDRAQRQELLARVRECWREATLIFISHDIGDSQGFERVLVIEEGQVIEDAAPAKLAALPTSRYRALLRAERAVRRGMWGNVAWRHIWLEKGHLQEREKGDPTP